MGQMAEDQGVTSGIEKTALGNFHNTIVERDL
jgi:hypothetical protein